MTELLDLGEDLIWSILQYCTISGIFRFGLVNTTCCTIANDEDIWEQKALMLWGEKVVKKKLKKYKTYRMMILRCKHVRFDGIYVHKRATYHAKEPSFDLERKKKTYYRNVVYKYFRFFADKTCMYHTSHLPPSSIRGFDNLGQEGGPMAFHGRYNTLKKGLEVFIDFHSNIQLHITLKFIKSKRLGPQKLKSDRLEIVSFKAYGKNNLSFHNF